MASYGVLIRCEGTDNEQNPAHGMKPRHGNVRRPTRPQTRATTASTDARVQSLAKVSEASPAKPEPRRSQRVKDLADKRNRQPQILRQETEQTVSGAKSQKQSKNQRLKGRKLAPQARLQEITKPRVTGKRNSSRVVKQQFTK